ncbi:MAG: tRNA (adenosine(37)-N6)-threonylcarbamoyltransferase complex ATPase subunit type 1 TsaE [Actinobacteria bacterium]|nr:tRNA (adenosine(37)-N6)-threonylcarbamoyltransferase complex ATPase subunit type 1 TsaE [Actinomycetota bacterium]MDI6831112.1 tRNA (adenosine(37)-N6)-threonylcarbamoyltransferase complex ATPase subunit type 1 TsaE [Actinomycetota bacterium]
MAASGEGAVRLVTRGPSETQNLGERLAEELRAGDVLLLVGELGTGKTCFAQGVARGLGVWEKLTSPTYTLLREYRGRLPLVHLDAYRLEGPLDLFDLGVEEYLEGDGVLVVEWADRARGFFRPPYLEVRFAYGGGEEERHIVFLPRGEGWRSRLTGLSGR